MSVELDDSWRLRPVLFALGRLGYDSGLVQLSENEFLVELRLPEGVVTFSLPSGREALKAKITYGQIDLSGVREADFFTVVNSENAASEVHLGYHMLNPNEAFIFSRVALPINGGVTWSQMVDFVDFVVHTVVPASREQWGSIIGSPLALMEAPERGEPNENLVLEPESENADLMGIIGADVAPVTLERLNVALHDLGLPAELNTAMGSCDVTVDNRKFCIELRSEELGGQATKWLSFMELPLVGFEHQVVAPQVAGFFNKVFEDEPFQTSTFIEQPGGMLVAIENHVAVTGGLTDAQMEFWLRSINKVSGDNAQTAVGLVHEIKKQHDAPATQSPAEGSQKQGKKKKKRWWHL